MEESLARIDAAAVAFFQHHSAEAHALLLSIELDVPLFSQMLVVRCFHHTLGMVGWAHGCVFELCVGVAVYLHGVGMVVFRSSRTRARSSLVLLFERKSYRNLNRVFPSLFLNF